MLALFYENNEFLCSFMSTISAIATPLWVANVFHKKKRFHLAGNTLILPFYLWLHMHASRLLIQFHLKHHFEKSRKKRSFGYKKFRLTFIIPLKDIISIKKTVQIFVIFIEFDFLIFSIYSSNANLEFVFFSLQSCQCNVSLLLKENLFGFSAENWLFSRMICFTFLKKRDFF